VIKAAVICSFGTKRVTAYFLRTLRSVGPLRIDAGRMRSKSKLRQSLVGRVEGRHGPKLEKRTRKKSAYSEWIEGLEKEYSFCEACGKRIPLKSLKESLCVSCELGGNDGKQDESEKKKKS
jgi:hypothetical protein